MRSHSGVGEGLYHIETSQLSWAANTWTSFFMIGTSIMKELSRLSLRDEVK